MRGNKREGGYGQFYSEDRAASALKPALRQDARAKSAQDTDPSQVHIERQEFID